MRVAPRYDGGWEVREPGRQRPLARAASEAHAVQQARALLTRGGTVQILDGGGFLVASQQVPGPADQPWWYLPHRGLFWALGLSFLVQGLIRVVDWRDPLHLGLGLVMTVLAGCYLALLVLSVRRDRRAARAGSTEAS